MRLSALLAQARNFFLLFFLVGTLSAQKAGLLTVAIQAVNVFPILLK
jgi:hypothetical protein